MFEALRLHPRWHVGLSRLLDLTDTSDTIAFGRLMRLIRTPFRQDEHVQEEPDGTIRRTRRFDVADDGDAELRATFAGVNTGDKQLLRRLGEARSMPSMTTCARATNILGDSKLRAPWAVAGDDARMHHILTAIHRERFADLLAMLRRHSGGCGAAGSSNDRLTFRQLQRALHEFDPFIHDAEILQYFVTMVNDVRGINAERLQSWLCKEHRCSPVVLPPVFLGGGGGVPSGTPPNTTTTEAPVFPLGTPGAY